jgi:hypothetical protein
VLKAYYSQISVSQEFFRQWIQMQDQRKRNRLLRCSITQKEYQYLSWALKNRSLKNTTFPNHMALCGGSFCGLHGWQGSLTCHVPHGCSTIETTGEVSGGEIHNLPDFTVPE